MTTLAAELPAKIKRLEASHGSDNPFVLMLKEQLRASKETKGKTAKEVYLVSAKSRSSEEVNPSKKESLQK